MRNYSKILLIIILTTFFACSKRKDTDNEIEAKALKFTNQINNNSIETFKKWSYVKRENAEIWSKTSFDNSDYSCIYLSYDDTTRITIGQLENFKKDFPYLINIDTKKYHRAVFYNLGGSKIRVLVTDRNGRDTILNRKVEIKKVFVKSNPFKYFDKLSKLKESLGIIGSCYRPDIGNFIEFYLSPENVLTYLPEKLYLNPKYKDVWLKNFTKGKTIKRNWNLRKLERPIDNG